MTFITDAFNHPDLATVKALPATRFKPGIFFNVDDADGNGTPAWYKFKQDDTTTVDEPSVAQPANATGRLFAMGLGAPGGGGGGSSLTTGTVSPIGNATPAAAGDVYIWNSSNSGISKKVYFYSTGTTNNDWVAYGGTTVVYYDVSFSGNPDFDGQQAKVFSSGSTNPSYDEGYTAVDDGTALVWATTY